MSITFGVIGATYTPTRVGCWVCDGFKVQGPYQRDDGTEYTIPCDYCHGEGTYIEQVCNTPELNMANGNAYALLREMGEDQPDCCGSWPYEKLVQMFGRAKVLQASPARMESTGSDTGGPGTGRCRVIEMGRSEEYVIDRAGRLAGVIRAALERKTGVCWG